LTNDSLIIQIINYSKTLTDKASINQYSYKINTYVTDNDSKSYLDTWLKKQVLKTEKSLHLPYNFLDNFNVVDTHTDYTRIIYHNKYVVDELKVLYYNSPENRIVLQDLIPCFNDDKKNPVKYLTYNFLKDIAFHNVTNYPKPPGKADNYWRKIYDSNLKLQFGKDEESNVIRNFVKPILGSTNLRKYVLGVGIKPLHAFMRDQFYTFYSEEPNPMRYHNGEQQDTRLNQMFRAFEVLFTLGYLSVSHLIDESDIITSMTHNYWYNKDDNESIYVIVKKGTTKLINKPSTSHFLKIKLKDDGKKFINNDENIDDFYNRIITDTIKSKVNDIVQFIPKYNDTPESKKILHEKYDAFILHLLNIDVLDKLKFQILKDEKIKKNKLDDLLFDSVLNQIHEYILNVLLIILNSQQQQSATYLIIFFNAYMKKSVTSEYIKKYFKKYDEYEAISLIEWYRRVKLERSQYLIRKAIFEPMFDEYLQNQRSVRNFTNSCVELIKLLQDARDRFKNDKSSVGTKAQNVHTSTASMQLFKGISDAVKEDEPQCHKTDTLAQLLQKDDMQQLLKNFGTSETGDMETFLSNKFDGNSKDEDDNSTTNQEMIKNLLEHFQKISNPSNVFNGIKTTVEFPTTTTTENIVQMKDDVKKDDVINLWREYEHTIYMDLVGLGFQVYLSELANQMLDNRRNSLVGDVKSLTRTARSAYELEESLDMGEMYF